VAGVFQGKSKKETAADGSSVEHRDDKAAVKGWFSFVPMCALRRGLLTFNLGAGAGNFSAVGAADLEETKKSDAADWREEGKINHI
jgi:hypothetical protein